MIITIGIGINCVRPAGPGGSGGLLVEDMSGGASPASLVVGYLLLEDGSFLLLE